MSSVVYLLYMLRFISLSRLIKRRFTKAQMFKMKAIVCLSIALLFFSYDTVAQVVLEDFSIIVPHFKLITVCIIKLNY
jgi:hypothetical protein